jgi:hypothetical protein
MDKEKVLFLTYLAFRITILIMVTVFTVHHLYYVGFGNVTVPPWYSFYDSNGSHVPFPASKAIKYWTNKGIVLSVYSGIATFVLSIIYYSLKLKRTKKEKLQKGL